MGEHGGGQGRINQAQTDAQIEKDAQAYAREQAHERAAQAYAQQRARSRAQARLQVIAEGGGQPMTGTLTSRAVGPSATQIVSGSPWISPPPAGATLMPTKPFGPGARPSAAYRTLITQTIRQDKANNPQLKLTPWQWEARARSQASQRGTTGVNIWSTPENAAAAAAYHQQAEGGAFAAGAKGALSMAGETAASLVPQNTVKALIHGHLPSLSGAAGDVATATALAGPDELMAPLRFARNAADAYRVDGAVTNAIRVATDTARSAGQARREALMLRRVAKAAQAEGVVTPVISGERQSLEAALRANPNLTPQQANSVLVVQDALARAVARMRGTSPEQAYGMLLHDVHYHGVDPNRSEITALHQAQTDIAREGARPEMQNLAHTPAGHVAKPDQRTIRAQARKLLAQHQAEVTSKKGAVTVVIPEQYRSVEGMTNLLNKLYDHAVQASEYRNWYELDARKILDHFGGNYTKAERLVDMIAILSPRAEVYSYVNESNNLGRALRAWNALERGQPIPEGVAMNDWQIPALERAFRGEYTYPEQELQAGVYETRPKTSRFARNFLYHINPEKYRRLYGDQQFGTMDVWMAHAFDYPKSAPAPGGPTYAFMNDATKAVADKLGWSIPQAQAAIWVTAKADKEGKSLEQAAVGFGHGLEHIPQREAVKGAIGQPGETYNELIARAFRTLTGRKGKPAAAAKRELDQLMTQWAAEHAGQGIEHFAAFAEPLRVSFQEAAREVEHLHDPALTERVQALLSDGKAGEALQALRGHPQAQDAVKKLLDPKIKAMIQDTSTGNVVTFFQRADVSSAIHELAHAVEPFLPAADRQALHALGVTSDEAFARTVERYFAEGIAPSPELETAYQHLSEGMLAVYGHAEAIPGAHFNPEIRHTFDRFMTEAEQHDPQFAARLKGALAQEETPPAKEPPSGEAEFYQRWLKENPHEVEVSGWDGEGEYVTETGYGKTHEQAMEDALKRSGIAEVGDVKQIRAPREPGPAAGAPPEKPPEEPPAAPPAPGEPPPDENAIPDYLRNDPRFWKVGKGHEISRWGSQELDRYRQALRRGEIKPGEAPQGYWTPEQQRQALAEAQAAPVEPVGPYTGMAEEPIVGNIGRRPEQPPPTPEAAAHAEANGIPIHEVNGTGENGRVTKPDVENEAFRRGTTPEQRLQKVLKGVKIRRGQTEPERAAWRSQKAARLAEAQAGPGTVAEKQAASKEALRGEMPTWVYEGVRKSLTQDDIEHLGQKIYEHPYLMPHQKDRAVEALTDLFETGRVLQPAETKLLTHIFGRDTLQSLREAVKHPGWNKLLQTLNIPRAFMASVDLSAPFRQGLVISTRHPSIFFKNFDDMVKAAGSEKAYEQAAQEIAQRPNFPKAIDGGLAVGGDLGGVTPGEEAFQSHIAAQIAAFPTKVLSGGKFQHGLVRGSERAYDLFLEKTRMDVYDHLVETAMKKGTTFNEQDNKDLCAYINMATGRGQLGFETLEKAANAINSVLFSPRLLASRVQFGVAPLNPRMYMNVPWGPKMNPFIRNEILRSWGQLSGAALTVLGLAVSAGAVATGKWVNPKKVGTKIVSGPISIEMDPRNSDFAKIRMRNTRIDFLGSFQQPFVAAMRLATRTSISSTTGQVQHLGSGFAKTTGFDIITRFFRGKLAPIPSILADSPWVFGQTFDFKKPTFWNELYQHTTPLAIQDAISMGQQAGGWPPKPGQIAKAAGAYALSGTGFGVQSYGAKTVQTPLSKLQAGAKMAGLPAPSKKILAAASLASAIQSVERKGKIDQNVTTPKAHQQMQAKVDAMRKLYEKTVGRPYKPGYGVTFVPNPTTLDDTKWDVAQIAYDIQQDAPGVDFQGLGDLKWKIDDWRANH